MIQWFQRKRNVINTALVLILGSLPTMSHAASIESILKAATTYLTGSMAKAAGLLAIVGAGYLTLYTQKLPKEYFIMILVGLGIIFGASSIYSRVVV